MRMVDRVEVGSASVGRCIHNSEVVNERGYTMDRGRSDLRTGK